MKWQYLACFLLIAFCYSVAAAKPSLPNVFSDHMVLQRDRPIPVWGWAVPGERVTVQMDGREAATAQTDRTGHWHVNLPPQTAGGPHELTVTSNGEAIVVRDVLVGEVWLCAGQSNMEFTVKEAAGAEHEIATANLSLIRHLNVPNRLSNVPLEDQPGKWEVCSSQTVGDFSAVAYFFARRLHESLAVPIGLINATWGGTRIEPWISPTGLAMVPSLQSMASDAAQRVPGSEAYRRYMSTYLLQQSAWLAEAQAALERNDMVAQPPAYPVQTQAYSDRQDPTVLHNAMLNPLVPYALRGVIWYQGEANRLDNDYVDKTRALVKGWRKIWQADLPYYYVQIAPYAYGTLGPDVLPRFWVQQSQIERELPDSSMAVISDVGEPQNIHPKNKQAVGLRLANQALKLTYGLDIPVFKGPRIRDMQVNGGTALLIFDDTGSGLASRDGQALNSFELIGIGTGWQQAEASVVTPDTVAVHTSRVPAPTAVRFGWHKLAQPNLMNREGLPAAVFMVGDVPADDPLLVTVPEARDYQLVYDLDLHHLGRRVRYDRDLRDHVTGPFDRVAYYLELQKKGEPVRWVFVSMDAFTDDVSRIGIPTLDSGVRFQMTVSNMNIWSNDDHLRTGIGIDRGCIEFWPNNYRPLAPPTIPDGDDNTRDFGDTINDAVPDGYGSMQVHWPNEHQTIFSINHWSAEVPDIGIGNAPGPDPDWTFSKNANDYTLKRLSVFVGVRAVLPN